MIRLAASCALLLFITLPALLAAEPHEKAKPTDLESAKKAFAAVGSVYRGTPYSNVGRQYHLFSLAEKGGADDMLKKIPDPAILYGFDCQFSPITDKGTAELPRLKNLAYLALISQPVSDESMKRLGECPGLIYLNLAAAKFSQDSLAHLAKSKSIRELTLNQTGISAKGVAEIAKMTELEHLLLDREAVTDEALKPLKSLTKLKSLQLWDTNKNFSAVGLQAFRDAESLEVLTLYNCTTNNDTLKEAGRHRNLKIFAVNSFDFNNEGVKELRFLTKMEDLSLKCGKINDEALGHLAGMTKLKRLDLGLTGVSDAAIADLRWFKNLEYVSVFGTKFTKEGAEKLRKILPKCRVQFTPFD